MPAGAACLAQGTLGMPSIYPDVAEGTPEACLDAFRLPLPEFIFMNFIFSSSRSSSDEFYLNLNACLGRKGPKMYHFQ